MISDCSAATLAFAIVAGIALAQPSCSSAILTPSVPILLPGIDIEYRIEWLIDHDGVVTDKTQTYTNGVTVFPGENTSIRKSFNTTVV